MIATASRLKSAGNSFFRVGRTISLMKPVLISMPVAMLLPLLAAAERHVFAGNIFRARFVIIDAGHSLAAKQKSAVPRVFCDAGPRRDITNRQPATALGRSVGIRAVNDLRVMHGNV